MPQFQTKRRVQHSAGNMFDLVADVERYPEFVPLCKRLHVTSRTGESGDEIITARMMVAYKMLQESFTSRIVLNREAQEIRVNYIDGPFRYLENLWTFQPINDRACEIGFRISYEFRSRILQTLMGAVFDKAFRKFAGAFEARADQVYGTAPRKTANDGPSKTLSAKASRPA
jgi:coenzyme Q-binding protein COQ10